MPSYVILGNYTDQGMKNIKDLESRLAAVKQQLEDAGGRLISWYLTFGPYDFVAVTEVPDTETGARITLGLGLQGNVRTTTMQALTEAEAIRIAESAQ